MVQLHVAGHHVHAAGLHIDTHAAPVCEEVYGLHVRWYRVTTLAGALLSRAHATRANFASLLPRTIAESGRSADAALLNEIASALTLAIERGVVRGARADQGSPS